MKARQLKSGDVFRLAGVIHAAKADLMDGLVQAQGDNQALGFVLIFSLIGQADKGVRDWLADMAGVTADELDAAPVNELMDLIEEITGQEEWSDFLGRLRGLMGNIAPAGTQSSGATAGVTNISTN